MNALPTAASKIQWRYSLAALLGWLFIAAAYFSLLGALLVVAKSSHPQIAPSTVVPATLCWLVLGAYYVRRHHYGALVVHAALFAIVLAIQLLTYIVAAESPQVRTTFYVGAVGAVVALPVSLASDLWRLLVDPASPKSNLVANVLAAVPLTALLGSVLSSLRLAAFGRITFFDLPGMVFGAILGVWLGCYMATSSCPPVAQMRVFGLSVRALAAGGLLGGVFGPLLNWYLASWVLGYWLLPASLSPLFGIVTAVAAGVISWRPRSASE
jgi:hypothetical protein